MKLSPMRADLTRRFVVRGLRINDNPKELVLLLRWAGNRAYQDALANKAFRGLEGDASTEELYRLFSEHVIVGWENAIDEQGLPISYTAPGGFAVMMHLRNEGRPDRLTDLFVFSNDGDQFQRELVDARDLGNA